MDAELEEIVLVEEPITSETLYLTAVYPVSDGRVLELVSFEQICKSYLWSLFSLPLIGFILWP